MGVRDFHVILLLLPAVAVAPSMAVLSLPRSPLLLLPLCCRCVVAVAVVPSIAVAIVALALPSCCRCAFYCCCHRTNHCCHCHRCPILSVNNNIAVVARVARCCHCCRCTGWTKFRVRAAAHPAWLPPCLILYSPIGYLNASGVWYTTTNLTGGFSNVRLVQRLPMGLPNNVSSASTLNAL